MKKEIKLLECFKRGSSYVTLCPEHKEQTPSFTFNIDKDVFKCFGCGISGKFSEKFILISLIK